MDAKLQKRNEMYEFGDFLLNIEEHRLERIDGVPIVDSIPEKAFQTLCVLVENGGHLLSKQELLEQIWPDSFVEENNLDKCIHILRNVLREKPGERRFIETVRKHGYRFVAEVKRIKYVEPRTKSGRFAFPEETREVSLFDWGNLMEEQESNSGADVEAAKSLRPAYTPKIRLIAITIGLAAMMIALYLYTSCRETPSISRTRSAPYAFTGV